ncbi:hypothetical protein SAMN04488541_10329 [Thermoflexibacter ruber]|uniref:Uncharacterized protein n=1 Tax=Thermoflexibacter ruber TaxID=1003 RepID=A0A1I2IHS8_9BACT|nr:hypothetical protein SAMN04488541_10329 [Thermoflexibacter ruber]
MRKINRCEALLFLICFENKHTKVCIQCFYWVQNYESYAFLQVYEKSYFIYLNY